MISVARGADIGVLRASNHTHSAKHHEDPFRIPVFRPFRHRGRRIDLRFEPGRMAVAADGKTIHDGPVRDIAL